VIDKSTLSHPLEGSLFWFSIPFSPDYGNLKQAPVVRCKSHSATNAQVHDPFSHRWFDHNGEILADACLNSTTSALSPKIPDFSSLSSDSPSVKTTTTENIVFSDPSFTLLQQKLSAAAAIDKALSVPTPNDQDVRKECVLVVDDSLAIVKMLKIMLEKNGFLVSTASNGLEAVSRVQESLDYLSLKAGNDDSPDHCSFDAILMDIQMPIMDGIEAINKIRQIEKEIKAPDSSILSRTFHHLIVAMSASSDDETVSSAYTAGADKFIAKPFNLFTFQQILQEYNERNIVDDHTFSLQNEFEKGCSSSFIPSERLN
jgi:CheY-like chemotaxis protein